MKFTKLTTKSSTAEVKKFLKELAYSPYAFHIDDDPNDIIWDPRNLPDEETLRTIDVNRRMMLNHISLKWESLWEIYHRWWLRAKRDQRVIREVERLLEQYGVVESTIFVDDTDDQDANIIEDWTTSILDAMNQYE